MMTVYKIGLGLGFLLLVACGESPSDIADQKLAPITSQSPPPKALSPEPIPVMPQAYQAAKDPFINPYRTAETRDAQAATDQDRSAEHTARSQPADVENRAIAAEPKPQPTASTSPPTTSAALPPRDAIAKGVQVSIDDTRVRQPLEQYDLSTLRYQGMLSDSQRIMALVISPDGQVHEVVVGQYLGRHHGRITHIDAQKIELNEAVLADDGRHYQRQAVIPFISK